MLLKNPSSATPGRFQHPSFSTASTLCRTQRCGPPPLDAGGGRVIIKFGYKQNTEVKLSIEGRVTGSGAVRPVYLGVSNKGVAAADALILSGAARVFESPVAGLGVTLALPRHICLVAARIADYAVPRRFIFLVVEIEVVERRTFPACLIERAPLALVVGEVASELADPVYMPLFDLIRLADP